jgi:hypothetical protein
MEAPGSYKMLVPIQQNTWHHIPEDHNLRTSDLAVTNMPTIFVQNILCLFKNPTRCCIFMEKGANVHLGLISRHVSCEWNWGTFCFQIWKFFLQWQNKIFVEIQVLHKCNLICMWFPPCGVTGCDTAFRPYKELEQENTLLKRRLARTHRALEETLAQLTVANQRKKQVEQAICKQLHKTRHILKRAKVNLNAGSADGVTSSLEEME